MRGTLLLAVAALVAGCGKATPIVMTRVTQLGSPANAVPAVVSGMTPLADGTVLLTCADQRVRVWDPESGSIRAEHPLPRDVIEAASAVSGASVALAVRFPATGVLLVDAKDPAKVSALDGSLAYVKALAAGGTTLALMGNNQGSKIDLDAPAESILELWDLSGVPKKVIAIRAATTKDSGAPAFSAVAVSPDGTLVATGSHDKRIAVREVATGKVVAEWAAHKRYVETIAFSPDGKQLVSADESEVAFWETATGTSTRRAFAAGHAPGLTWSPDGTQVLDGQNLIEVADGSRRALEGFEDRAYGSVFLADGKRVAFGGLDARVRVFDRATAKETGPADSHRRAVSRISWSPDGTRIATTGGDGRVLVFEADSGTLVAAHETDTTTGPHQGTAGAGILADGVSLIAGGASGVHLLDGKGGVAPAWNRGAVVEALAVSPERTRVALGDGAILDTTSGAEIARFPRTTAVLDLSFSADGTLLAIGSTDDAARLIDAVTGAVKSTRNHSGWVKAVAVSPAGALTSAGSGEKKIVLSEGFFGKSASTPEAATSLAWSPDGKTLAAAAGAALLFDAKGRLAATLPGTERARSVAFSPDGSRLAVGLANGTTLVFRDP